MFIKRTKNAVLKLIIASAISYLCLILTIILFRNMNWFDMGNRSNKSIFVEGVFISVVWFFINLYLYQRRSKKDFQ